MINTDHNSLIKNDKKIQESIPEQTKPLHNYNESQNACRICKKVLLDYISMHRFIGPECWEEFIQNINNSISLESIANKYKISINDLIIPIGTYLLDNGQTIPTIMNRLGMKKMPVIELLKIPLREKITMLHNRGLPYKYISEKLKLNVKLIKRIRLENIDNQRSHSQSTDQITDFIKEIDEKNNKKGLESISYTYFGILWEDYIKVDLLAQRSLKSHYHLKIEDEMEFTEKIPLTFNLHELYSSNYGENLFIEKEIKKKFVIFDIYIPSKKIIIEMKLSSLSAINFKDIAYLLYFPDHQLHFFFFLPNASSDSFRQQFEKKITSLVHTFNAFLPHNKELDVKNVLERIKLLTRNDLQTFPNLGENLMILKKYLHSPPYTCNYCEHKKEFTRYFTLVQHKNSEHDPQENICNFCSNIYPTKYKLKRHKNEKHSGPQTCDQCNKTVKNKAELYEHQRNEHSGPQTCGRCKKRFASITRLNQHSNLEHSDSQTCRLCGKICNNKSELKRHKHTEHSGPQTCSLCSKICKNKIRLYAHKDIKHSEPQRCKLCDLICNNKTELRQHKYAKHSGPQTCLKCGKTFNSKMDMTQHNNIDHSSPQICEQCNEVFKNKPELYEHKRKHKDIPRFCSKCGVLCKNRSQFSYHNRTKHRT